MPLRPSLNSLNRESVEDLKTCKGASEFARVVARDRSREMKTCIIWTGPLKQMHILNSELK